MQIFNFSSDFIGAIEVGLKQQAIRKVRKYPVKSGDKLYLYTGLRTGNCRQLFPDKIVICDYTTPIRINKSGQVFLDGEKLTGCYLRRFAEADGFTNISELISFIKNIHGLPFDGIVIYWFCISKR